ncbi:MAG: MFS transporter [Acidimicrobiales bacterium]
MDRDALAAMPESTPRANTSALAKSRGGSLRALHSQPFRLYFAGQIVSASGTFLQQTAVGWLVLKLTGSAGSLGLVLAAGGLPSLALGPWGGSIADRLDLRKLLVVTQFAFGLLAGSLWILAAAGHANVPAIILVSVLGGFVSIVDSPARQAFVSQLVPSEDLASAVSLNGVVVNSARVVGPAVAGILIVTVGTTPCFAVNALSYVPVVWALLIVRPLHSQRAVGHAKRAVRQGLSYVKSRNQLWLPLVMMSLVGLLAFNFSVILPVFAKSTFHGSGGTYGLMTTMLSVGSIAGSFAVGFISHPRRHYLVVSSLAFGVALILAAASPNVPLACVALVICGVAGFSFVTLASTTLQLHSSAAFRGRVMALWIFVYIGTTPIGSVLTGWIADAGGARLALVVGAGSCFAASAFASRVRKPPTEVDDSRGKDE